MADHCRQVMMHSSNGSSCTFTLKVVRCPLSDSCGVRTVVVCVLFTTRHGPRLNVCQTLNAFICVSPNALKRVSPSALFRVSPNALIRVSPNALVQTLSIAPHGACSAHGWHLRLDPTWTRNGPNMDPKLTKNRRQTKFRTKNLDTRITAPGA